jgi:hypothetical protein
MTCTHGHAADPKLCPACKSQAARHTDPDIQAAWRDQRDALAAMLRPYVQAHLVQDLAQRYIDGLEQRGWRPPLRPPEQTARIDPETAQAATARGYELARSLLERG